MTPKEEAQELLEKYNKDEILYHSINYHQAKKCALIAVDEIINLIENMTWIENKEYYTKANYWSDVKQEIEKL